MKTTITIIGLSAILVCLIASAQTQPRAAGGGLAERFKQLDRNGDGKLSADEFPGPQFKQMDKNGDGFVTLEEARAFYAGRGAAPAAPAGGQASPPAAGKFKRVFEAGRRNAAGQFLGGTEIRVSAPYDGKLYVGNNYWLDQPGGDPTPGPAILVLDQPDGEWRVEHEYADSAADGSRRCLGVSALEPVSFGTDGGGKALPYPAKMLMSGCWVKDGDAIVAARDHRSGSWVEMALPAAKTAAKVDAALRQRTGRDGFAGMTFGSVETRCLLIHRDRVTGVDRLFAGVRPVGVFTGVYDPQAPGQIRWDSAPEWTSPPTDRIMGFTECDGVLHVVAGRSLYRRLDGPQPRWEKVYTNSDGRSVMTSLRGPTAIPNPTGRGQAILVALEGTESRIIRLDPRDRYAAVVELDVLAFLEQVWGVRPLYAEAGINHREGSMTKVVDPRTGSDTWLIGLGAQLGAGNRREASVGGRRTFFGLERGAWYLVRDVQGRYRIGQVQDFSDPLLIAPRTFTLSPFPKENGAALYVGGYDCWGKPAHNTGWVYRGSLEAVLGAPLAAARTELLTAAPVPVTSPTVGGAPAKVYWGDLHAHTAYSYDARVGQRTSATPAEAMVYAREKARLDFVAITDHDYSMSREQWREEIAQANAAYEPGRFVPIIAYEWTEARNYGHRNVFFRGDKVPEMVFGALNIPQMGGQSVVRRSPVELWAALRDYEAFTIPHQIAQGVGSGGRNNPSQNWDYVNGQQQPALEVFSKHGSSEREGTAQPIDQLVAGRTAEAALRRWLDSGDVGYKLGMVAGTDDHRGLPGGVADASPPLAWDLPYSGGLTAVFAPELTREAIFDAIKARHTYATSGPRIGLTFTARAGDATVMMGDTLVLKKPGTVQFQVSATGDSAPVAKIEVLQNGKIIAKKAESKFGLTLQLTGRNYFRVVVYQVETASAFGGRVAERAWSSPIWVEAGDP